MLTPNQKNAIKIAATLLSASTVLFGYGLLDKSSILTMLGLIAMCGSLYWLGCIKVNN